MEQTQPVQYSFDREVATITLNRPEKRNALNRESVDLLTKLVARAEDERARAIVIAGEGPVFCAGADLAYLRELQEFSLEENIEDSRALAQALQAIYSVPIPVIARIHGHAIAGGCGLATVCDVVIAVERAKFGYTEVGIGFIPAIVTAFLIEKAPHALIRELLLTGRIIDANEAARRAIVTEVVPDIGMLDESVEAICDRLRDADRGAVSLTKEMIRTMQGMTLDSAIEYGVHMNAVARSRPECKAGISAFLDRD